MKASLPLRIPACLLAITAGAALNLPAAHAFGLISESEEITSVSSKVFNGYKRAMLSDGSNRPETYGVVVGGLLVSVTSDDSMDKITFSEISKIVIGPLASQRYIPTEDPQKADLLIVVFWGRTSGSTHFNGVVYGPDQDTIDARNAALLGFDSESVFGVGFGNSFRSHMLKELHADVMDAIRVDRYFVILQAFDCQSALKGHALDLCWETRFSLSQRRHDFGQDLPRMAQVASHYFGEDSHGLVHKAVPEGHVEIGTTRSLGEVSVK